MNTAAFGYLTIALLFLDCESERCDGKKCKASKQVGSYCNENSGELSTDSFRLHPN